MDSNEEPILDVATIPANIKMVPFKTFYNQGDVFNTDC
jgi:hypothetical protein